MPDFLGIPADTGGRSTETVAVNHSSNSVRFSVSGIEVLSVRHDVETEEDPRPIERYISCLCYTGRAKAGDFARVEFAGGEQTTRMGYVFPANCFSEPELFDGGWPAKFAEVGFRKSVSIENISRFSRLRLPPDATSLGDLTLDQVFSEEISVLVIGIDAARKTKMSLKELELSLICSGIYPLDDPDDIKVSEVTTPREGKYTLRRVSSYFRVDAHHFVRLIRRADRDRTGVGAFLTYYQVVEYCISFILGWSVRDLTYSNLDAWRLRDALSDAANEGKRFNKLYSHHTSPSCDHGVFEELRLESLKFIQSLGVDNAEGWGWCEAVYKSRNMIVHNQISIFRSGSADKLSDLNRAMRSACLEIVAHFIKDR